MRLAPINLADANSFVLIHHRHHKPVLGAKFALAAMDVDQVVGVAIVGRPVARMADNGMTLEVVRVATNGHKNACSFLYSSCWRAAQALGFTKLITYTLPSEGGASLRGAGWRCLGSAGGGDWHRESRPRVETTEEMQQAKMKWEAPQKPLANQLAASSSSPIT